MLLTDEARLKQYNADIKAAKAAFEPDESCPIITWFTRFLKVPDAAVRNAYAARKKQPFVLPPMPGLRTTLVKTGQPLRLRDYQGAMAVNMLTFSRFMNGDAVGLGKTLVALASFCAARVMERGPQKLIVFTTTSTSHQWASEVVKFTTLRPFVLRDDYKFKGAKKKTYGFEARIAQLHAALNSDKVDVIICRYSQFQGRRRTFTRGFDDDGNPTREDGKEQIPYEIRKAVEAFYKHRKNIVIALDETHRIKGADSLYNLLVRKAKKGIPYIWELTATTITNHLVDFYSLASTVGITPLGTLGHFKLKHCIYENRTVSFGRVQEVLTGYRGVPEIKQQMRPFFWGRTQKQVEEPMPRLQTEFHPLDLNAAQAKLLLDDIPSGAYVLPPTWQKDKETGELILKERNLDNQMVWLAIYQAVANTPALLEPENPEVFLSKTLSPKEEALLDLLDGRLAGEKVIVFTKSRRWIDRLEHLTKIGAFTERKFLRITGLEKPEKREANRVAFQEDPEHDLIFINAAAIEGVNLQEAGHLVCLDLPWSWGSMSQLVGRMVRMASPHLSCMLHVLLAKGTIDEFSLETLRVKKHICVRILGASGVEGILDDDSADDLKNMGMEIEDDEDEYLDLLKAHVKKIRMSPIVSGQLLRGTKVGASVKIKETTEQADRGWGSSMLDYYEEELEFAE